MHKITAKKSLGQHFLNSKHVLDQIISAAKINKDEQVLEIGPGTGVLTRALLTAGAKVTAIEKDDRVLGLLKASFVPEIESGQLEIIHGDVLDGSLAAILALQNKPFALIANIPYYITGAILERFLEGEIRPNRMVILVQKEVAERIVARDGKESVLSMSVKAFGTPKIVATVPPGAFTPPPTVDSAILAIENISDERFQTMPDRIPMFFKAVRAGFAHKRKYLKSNLAEFFASRGGSDSADRIWERLGIDPRVRAEQLTIGQWIEIVKCE